MTVYKLKRGTVFYGNGCIKECMCTCMCVRRGAGEGLRLLHFTDQKYLLVKSRLRSKNKCNCEVSFSPGEIVRPTRKLASYMIGSRRKFRLEQEGSVPTF